MERLLFASRCCSCLFDRSLFSTWQSYLLGQGWHTESTFGFSKFGSEVLQIHISFLSRVLSKCQLPLVVWLVLEACDWENSKAVLAKSKIRHHRGLTLPPSFVKKRIDLLTW